MNCRYPLARFTAGAILATAAYSGIQPVTGAVPVSIAVRTQAPDVEPIIQAMEAKAVKGTGTWQTVSGRQDALAQPWVTGIGPGKNGAMWYWQSLAQSPSPYEGVTLFNDGEDAYLMPFGANQQSGGTRFQFDALRTGAFGGGRTVATSMNVGELYLMGHYLLHLNLNPRYFMGSLGGLGIVGKETLDGFEVVHLKTDPQKDLVAKTDLAITRRFRRAVPVLDLYYSPEKRSVVKAEISNSTASSRIELLVSAWDAFGTNETWPSKIVGRLVNSGPATRPATQPATRSAASGHDEAVLTAVSKFTPGIDKAIEAVSQRRADEPFFLTSRADLREPDFYRESLKLRDNMTDRIALAEASFVTGDILDGLNQWRTVEANTRLSSQFGRLRFVLAPMAENGLQQVMPEFDGLTKDQRLAVVRLTERFVTTLDDRMFGQMSYTIAEVWNRTRNMSDLQLAMAPVTPNVLARLAVGGDVASLQSLVALAESSKDDGALIDPVLKSIMDKPVPDAGLLDSRQDYLIAAAVRAGALDRALTYVNGLQWGAGVPDSQKQVAKLWMNALVAAKDLALGREAALADAIASYKAFGSLPIEASRTDHLYGQYVVVAAGQELIDRHLEKSEVTALQTLIRQSSTIDGAEQYWAEALQKVANANVLNPEKTLTQIGPTVRAYSEVFKRTTFESKLWMRLVVDSNLAGKYLRVETEYLNKALAAAPDDTTRMQVVQLIGQAYARVKEYRKGAAVVEQTTSLIGDEKMRNQLLGLVKQLQNRQTIADKDQHAAEIRTN